MAATILDGKAVAQQIQEELAKEAGELRERGIVPTLAVVLVGDDPASHTYVRSKLRTAERLGIESRDHLLPASTHQSDVVALVRALNHDPEVHAILVQSPVPAPLNYRTILDEVD